MIVGWPYQAAACVWKPNIPSMGYMYSPYTVKSENPMGDRGLELPYNLFQLKCGFSAKETVTSERLPTVFFVSHYVAIYE